MFVVWSGAMRRSGAGRAMLAMLMIAALVRSAIRRSR